MSIFLYVVELNYVEERTKERGTVCVTPENPILQVLVKGAEERKWINLSLGQCLQE